jgi:hypothetical protein
MIARKIHSPPRRKFCAEKTNLDKMSNTTSAHFTRPARPNHQLSPTPPLHPQKKDHQTLPHPLLINPFDPGQLLLQAVAPGSPFGAGATSRG